jgi:GNAT superfamily N-acetyltransferase
MEQDDHINAQLESIHIRPIQPTDWHRLQLFHQRLSSGTVELRFHGAKRELSTPLALRFTGVDGQNDVAFVATTGTRGRIVGVARYSRVSPTCAEVAFVVEDGFQGHGVGSRLMRRLIESARQNGITELVAEVMAGNTPMFRLLRQAGPTRVDASGGVCEVHVDLSGPPQ